MEVFVTVVTKYKNYSYYVSLWDPWILKCIILCFLFSEADKIPVMRGQWFIDGTWQPLEEKESNLIEQEHLSCFRGQQMQENFDIEVSKSIDGKDGKTN